MIEERPIQNKKRYFFAFVIGTCLFFMFLGTSWFFSNVQYQKITDIQGITAYSIFESKLSYDFFENDICSEDVFQNISGQLAFQGDVINDLEERFGKNDEKVLNRKKLYTVVLLEHFDFINTYNEQCDANINTILFFYSNVLNSEQSITAGKILDSVYYRNQNVMIYSFDIDLNSEVIKNLKEKYGIEGSPVAIVNGQNKIDYPFVAEDIEQYLN